MEHWSVEKKDIKPLAIIPTLQYSNAPNFIYWIGGILGLGLQINACELDPRIYIYLIRLYEFSVPCEDKNFFHWKNALRVCRGLPARRAGVFRNPERTADWRKVRPSGIDFQEIRYWVLGIGD